MSWTDEELLAAKRLLSLGRVWACRRAPFLSSMIYTLITHPTDQLPDGVGTAVTKKGVMLFNPAVLKDWTVEDAAVGVIHESEHLRRLHFTRKMDRDPTRWNLAGDAEINDDIKAMGFKLLDSDVLPRDFNALDGKTAEIYYKLEMYQPKQKCCGSGSGNPVPGEKKIPGMPKLGKDRKGQLLHASAETSKAIVQAAKSGQGNVPAGLLRDAENLLAPPKVSWDRKLIAEANRAVAWRAGFSDTTFRKPNRRQGGIGYGVGKPILASHIDPVPRVALVQDTSASMDTSQIKSTIAEASEILRSLGTPITFMACDARVHTMQSVEDPSQIAALMKGGGGTDFRPAFDALRQMKDRPDIVVFSTDAAGTFPERPDWCSVIWLLSCSWGSPYPTPWGTRIEVPR